MNENTDISFQNISIENIEKIQNNLDNSKLENNKDDIINHPLNVEKIEVSTIPPFVNLIKDILLNVFFNIPEFYEKLNEILKNQNNMIKKISEMYGELKLKLEENEIEKLERFINFQNKNLITILQNSFKDILEDGIIDEKDTPAILSLILNVVNLFNDRESVNTNINLSVENVVIFLEFLIKCFVITLFDDVKEKNTIQVVELSFKLISFTILPLKINKCCKFF